MSNRKYSKEFKLCLIKEHEENGVSFYQLDKEHGLSFGTVRHWLKAYQAFGEDGLERKNSMLCNYSAEFKQQIVTEYLEGGISALDLAHKYGIRGEATVCNWVNQYNGHKELTDSRPEQGERFMAKQNEPRKTTLEERTQIVSYCIANGKNYALTANTFQCSYGQVYAWVQKYEAHGIEGLYDRRGRSKTEEELTELEKLQAENRLLKARNKQQQMEIDFLKKLEAVERR